MSNEPSAGVVENKWKSGLIGGFTGALAATVVGFIFSSTALSYISKLFGRNSLPPKAIIFVHASDCGAIGDGWKELALAKGRFLVGAGGSSDHPGTSFQPGMTGKGSLAAKIEERNLPQFSASVTVREFGIGVGGGGSLNVLQNPEKADGGSKEKRLVSVGGGSSQPIDTVPPWIALTACEKNS